MSASELETQINRFKVNEERLNTFVNVDGFYTTSSGVQVPTLLNVSKRIEVSAENVSLAEQSATNEITRQTDLVIAASTSAQAEFLNEDSKINTLAKNTIADWLTAINTITQTEGVPALAVSTANNETQQSINDSVGAKWYAKGGGYPINYRVMLDNGDIVKSTVANNTTNPNVDMSGWINSLSASFVVDASGENQQGINDGVNSIAQLRTINPKKKGARIYLKSVIQDKDLGGGMFVSTQKAGLVDNGGTVIASPDPALFWVRVNYDNVIPQFWGALGDGENDDRPAFQSAIDYLRNIGGGELVVPKPLASYMWKSYDTSDSACLVIPVPTEGVYGNPISIRGLANDTKIIVNLGIVTNIEAAILLKGGGHYKKFENITVWGGPSNSVRNCNYVLKGIDTYYPDFYMSNCQFYSAVESTVRLATYVAIFNKVRGAYAKKFIHITGPEGNLGGEVTALTFNSCYGLNVTEHSIYLGHATYCTLNACAADHVIGDNAYPYYIDLARGVSFNGCGAESSDRIMYINVAQGVTINGLMTLNIGNNENPPAELIRINGGESITIAGLWNQNKRAAQCILRLGGSFSTESVTVLDQSLEPSDVIAPSNYRFQNPVRFLLRDFSRKTQETVLTNTGNATTNAANLQKALDAAHSTELLHDVIVRFPQGDFPIGGIVYMSNHLTRGGGRIRLIGHADNTSRIVATGNGSIYFGAPLVLQDLTYQVENLNLHIGAVTAPNKGFHFFKGATNFINSKITSNNTFRQYYAESNPTIRLDSNSSIQTNYYGDHTVEFTYKATTAPTSSTRLPAGTIFKASDPNATRIGWINTADNGATWLALTA